MLRRSCHALATLVALAAAPTLHAGGALETSPAPGHAVIARPTQHEPRHEPQRAGTTRWTDATPDAMIDDAVARGLAASGNERAQVAVLSTVMALADRADHGHAQSALERLSRDEGFAPELRREGALLARMLAPDDGTQAGLRANEQLGVVDAIALLGPFRDTGGGLDLHDGPETRGGGFGDTGARYSWGSYDVAWRAIPPAFASAEGVPLDVFVFPRKESCTWVATKLTVGSSQRLTLRLAATGQARLVFDGVDVARDEAVHAQLRFDRLAATVAAASGAHLVAAKICSGALDDDGRVRLRVTTASGGIARDVLASADLSGLAPRTARAFASTLAVEHTATPLDRALRDPAIEPDAQLAACLLRTLGGADDLRSPRAPGLLAALADHETDADRLAMAAWLSPSGANRSAWLNRARSSASADARTRAFVDRRLVERHLEAGLPDWAMATLRGAALDSASDGEALLLGSRVAAALGPDALRLGGVHRLATYADATPDAADAVLERLAELAAPYDSRRASAARDRLAERGENGAERVTAVEIRGRDDVIAAARRAFDGGIDTAESGLTVAEAVAHSGAHDEARNLYGQLARWAPNRAPVWAGLARELGAGEGDPARADAISAALRRARELDPGDARYRAELALRDHSPVAGEPHDDEKYLVTSAVILARRQGTAPSPHAPAKSDRSSTGPEAKAPPPPARAEGDGPPLNPSGTEAPDVADRELHWLRAVVMHPDRRVSELVHYAREIVIPPRTEDELYEDIPAEGDRTEIVKARVHRKDGGTAFPVEQESDGGKPRIRWPELGAGDVVEVAFRSWTAGPVGGRGDPPFYRLDFAGSVSTHPVLHNEVTVESPLDHPIFVDVMNGAADRREEKDVEGRHLLRLVWDKPVNVADEPLSPPLSEIVPTVVLSTFKDWGAFRGWYGEAVRGFTEPDAQVRELAAKLTKGKASRDDKLRALFNFVADDIRYVNYVSGEWWLPNRPQQLLARREGDCDDKALLLITLLKASGMDAQEVLVQTRLTGQPSVLRARGAAVPLFDHGIAHLPGPDGGTYLDATSPQSRLGPLPSMDARAVALRMDGPAEIVALPGSSPADHGVDSRWTVELKPDGSASLDGRERATGDDAFWLRTNLTEQGSRAPWVEQHLVGPWFPTVDVDKQVEFRGDLPGGAAVVHWRAASSGLARHESDELVVPLSPSQTIASQLAPLVNRTLPVWLAPHIAPRNESRTIRVIAPSGWTFAWLPSGGDENGGSFGHAHLEVTRDPHNADTLVVHRTVVFDQNAIPVDDYPRWRAWVQRVDALMHRTVRLAPRAASVP